VFVSLVSSAAGGARVDDAILVPLATSAEERAAIAALGPEHHLRQIFIGGGLFLVGGLVTWATYANHASSYVLAWGPIVGGALTFVRGLVGYLASKR
jgi:hypothetical protein